MDETIEELYQKYLKEKLYLIFKDSRGQKFSFYPFSKPEEEKPKKSEFYRYKDFTPPTSQDIKCHIIKKDGKYQLIGPDEKPINDEKYDRVDVYPDHMIGIILTGFTKKYIFLDIDGKPITNKWYKSASGFKNGFAQIEDENGNYNLIDCNGNEVFKGESKFYVSEFNGEYAEVERYINRKGSYDRDADWNLLYPNGKLVLEKDKWIRKRSSVYIGGIHDGAVAYIERIVDFHDGYIKLMAQTRVGGLRDFYNYMNTQGEYISDEWFSFLGEIKNGKIIVSRDDLSNNIIDLNGNKLLDKWRSVRLYGYNNSFTVYNYGDIVFCENEDLKDYQVKKTLTGYRCSNENEEFNIKYQPVKIFDSQFVLCIKKKDGFLFDRKNGKYTSLGDIKDIEFTDNFLRIGDKINLIYEGQVIDITSYYNSDISKNKEHFLNSGVEILSKDEFFIGNEEDIRKRFKKAREENRKLREERNKKVQIERAKELQKIEEKEELKNSITKQEALYNLRKSLKTLRDLEKNIGVYERIPADDIFIDMGNYKEIDPVILEMGLLRLFDLSHVSFRNVKVSGVDFRGCNISLNPQEVYPTSKPDLSNCNFEGISIPVSTNFTGVNISGAKFTNNQKSATFDIRLSNFVGAIYDDKTTLNGLPISKEIEKLLKEEGKSSKTA